MLQIDLRNKYFSIEVLVFSEPELGSKALNKIPVVDYCQDRAFKAR
jgi:hypothetical protein